MDNQKIFAKTIVKTYVYNLTLLKFYQSEDKANFRLDYPYSLNKFASPTLVQEFKSISSRYITKIKNWYVDTFKNFKNEVSHKRLDECIDKLAIEPDIDLEEGYIPFTNRSIDWNNFGE